MLRYERPVVLKTYSLAELQADAATCTPYLVMTTTVGNVSDERLKTDIESI